LAGARYALRRTSSTIAVEKASAYVRSAARQKDEKQSSATLQLRVDVAHDLAVLTLRTEQHHIGVLCNSDGMPGRPVEQIAAGHLLLGAVAIAHRD